MPIATLFADPETASDLARRIDARRDHQRRAAMLGLNPRPARNTRRHRSFLHRLVTLVAGRSWTCCITRR